VNDHSPNTAPSELADLDHVVHEPARRALMALLYLIDGSDTLAPSWVESFSSLLPQDETGLPECVHRITNTPAKGDTLFLYCYNIAG
jgi:hypothetical protein